MVEAKYDVESGCLYIQVVGRGPSTKSKPLTPGDWSIMVDYDEWERVVGIEFLACGDVTQYQLHKQS